MHPKLVVLFFVFFLKIRNTENVHGANPTALLQKATLASLLSLRLDTFYARTNTWLLCCLHTPTKHTCFVERKKKRQMKICPTFCSHLKASLLGQASVPLLSISSAPWGGRFGGFYSWLYSIQILLNGRKFQKGNSRVPTSECFLSAAPSWPSRVPLFCGECSPVLVTARG